MAFHPNAHSLIRVLFLLLSATSVCAAEPKQASWSNKPHGADGPWNAVTVSIGGQSDIALFPGRMFHTFVTTSDYCALNASTPQCESGTYLKDKVFEGKTRGAQGIRFRLPGQEYTSGIRVRGADASMFLDTLDLGSSGGRVDNASIALIESQMLEYPSGSHYPIFTGCLSVGAPDPKQVFVGSADIPTVNASLLPWALAKDDAIPSSSFGLHYGSAVASSAKMFGSLLYGGYDKNRVVGNVLSIDGHLWKPVLLQDISIRVVKGSSPFVKSFPSSNKNNLLRAGNSSIPTQGLPVILDPCSPYLTLPKSTCDAIADNLPVKYNDSLGLYLWDTTDPRYIQITTSASVLSFTFMGSSNTQTLNISVPFGHLNLSLAPPFMSSENPVPYFPCFTGGIGAYVLGRAFFQDAFLGANWEQKKLFLAQAPGPNIPAAVEAANIESGDATIKAGRNNWESSWEGVWRALTLEEASGSGSAPPPPPSGGPSSPPIQTADDKKGSEGLAAGAKIGIGVSVALAVLAGIAVGVFIWRRKQKTYGIRLDEGRLKAFPESTFNVANVRKTTTAYPGHRGIKEADSDGIWLVEAPAYGSIPMTAADRGAVYEMPAAPVR